MNYIDVKTPIELYQYMKENIRYGFISKDDNKICLRKELGDELYETKLINSYFLQRPDELITNKCGICYDYVELERKWFLSHGYKVYTYYTPYHNHTVLIYSDSKKYYFFERSFKEFNGIYEFNNLEDALKFYVDLQKKHSNNKIKNILLYKYDSVLFGCSFREFIDNIKTNNNGKLYK